MTEEIKDETSIETSPTEEKAKEKGWKPEAEYEGDPDEWVDAKEFLGREKLYDALHNSNRKIKKLTEQMSTLSDWHNKTEKAMYDKALRDLNAAKAQAIQAEDAIAVVKLDTNIRELEKTPPKPTVEPKENNEQVFNSWLEKNDWYKEDAVLKRFATGVGFSIEQEHPEWSVEEVLEEVSREVKTHHPDKFSTPKRTTSVLKTTNVTGSVKKADKLMSYEQLPEEAKNIYKKLVKTKSNPNGMLTHEQYIKEYMAVDGR